jgi:Tol biopolymer transport system component
MMSGDRQLRERFERAGSTMELDTAGRLERVRRAVERRERSRRLQALAVAAAIALGALVVAWQFRSGGGSAIPLGSAPSGRLVYLGSDPSGSGLLVLQMDVGTGEIASVVNFGRGSAVAPAWSPDGTRLATAYVEEGVSSGVVVHDGDGSDPVTVLDQEDSGLVGPDLLDVSWSPDGSRIAVAARAVAHGRTIVIVDAAGGGTQAILDGHWESVSWSPDGSRLVAVGFPQLEGSQFDVYTMRPDGTDLEQLTDDAAVEHNPSWSPDGTKIVFDTGEEYERDVYVMDADGSDLHAVTEAPGLDFFPVWSPDGEWIAFASDRALSPAERERNRSGEVRFRTRIHLMRADGSDVGEPLIEPLGAFETTMLPVSWTE